MNLISLTNIPLNTTPDTDIVFHMSWRRKKDADIPSNYTPLPDATVDPTGTITDPTPYKFTVPETSIVVKAVSICGGEFQKLFIICELVADLSGSIKPSCDSGYDLSDDETYCFKSDEVAASLPSSGEITVAKSAIQYSTCGTYLYSSFDQSGSGSHTLLSPTGAFWKNGGTCADNNTVDGPMNRCGLWATTTYPGQDIGFSVCLDIATSKTYYIGIGCDNYGIIKLDGNTIIQQDETIIDTMYGIGGSCFKVWHIYPVKIPAGAHVIELIGHNVNSIAALGAEIYNNTVAELASATSYSDLDLVFSTKDYVGEMVQYGTGGLGYSCPNGYALVACQDPFVCRRTLTNTPSSGKLKVTFTPESGYGGQYKAQIYDTDDLGTAEITDTISPPYSGLITKNYVTDEFGDYVIKLTALGCNKSVAQKQVHAADNCSEPLDLTISNITSSGAKFTWDNAEFDNSNKFHWEVYNNSSVLIQSGTFTGKTITITGLSSAQNYTFKVYTNCDPGVLSTPAIHAFTTS